jgi:hypothetical protein
MGYNMTLKTKFLTIILFSFLILLTIYPAVANSFTFSDLGLSSSTIDVYSYDPGIGQWILNKTINSSETMYYDPLTNYNFVIRPSASTTYFSSPTGILTFFLDNGAQLLTWMIAIILLAVFAGAILKGVIR